MIVDCIADLHGFYPKLEGGDLLIVAGDLTARDKYDEYVKFFDWVQNQSYKRAIIIAGNHDNKLQEGFKPVFNWENEELSQIDYLCDSGIEFEGLKIWGSPWTKTFKGMNPNCKAFTCKTDEQLSKKWDLIPDNVDILISHGPSYGLHDSNTKGERCGSPSLTKWIANHVNSLKLFVCGHIHEAYGIYNIRKLQDRFDDMYTPIHINSSHVNERYQPINKPIRVIL